MNEWELVTEGRNPVRLCAKRWETSGAWTFFWDDEDRVVAQVATSRIIAVLRVDAYVKKDTPRAFIM